MPPLLQGLPAPYTLAATTTPANLISIFDSSRSFGVTNLLMIAVGGLDTAVVRTLLPARWGARASVVTVLRAE